MIALAAALLLTAAEPPSWHPTQAPAPIEVVLKNDKAEGPRTVRAKRGENVTLRISSDRKIVLHLHGYDLERTAEPESPAVFSFIAKATGRFPIEEHVPSAGKKSHSHSPAILYIEILPN